MNYNVTNPAKDNKDARSEQVTTSKPKPSKIKETSSPHIYDLGAFSFILRQPGGGAFLGATDPCSHSHIKA
jgi:hypothetical protein